MQSQTRLSLGENSSGWRTRAAEIGLASGTARTLNPTHSQNPPVPAPYSSEADTDMALTRRLLPVALLALCWGLSMAGAQGTIPLQTLSCHNDYTSRIVCRWADTQDAQRFINVTLHRRLNEDPPQPVACRLSDDTSWLDDSCLSCVPRSCVIPYKFFALADRDYFSFRPDRPLGAQLNINLAQHGDKAQPRDLQCFFDGAAALSCSWEVRTEVASSVSFALFYRSSPDAGEEQCSPVLQDQPGSPYILHRCQIPVPDPRTHSQYLVSVRPKEEEKFIKSSENIQMVPPTLNVTRSTDGYVLLWKAEEMMYKHIGHTFEVQYKKDTASWEDSRTESLQNAHSMSLPRLEPSTKYQARVRVKPTPGSYNGIWSEWSEECSWVTEWELSVWVLALIMVFATLVLLPALRFCVVYGYRLNQKWEEKIPNPSKSHLFQNGSAGLRLPDSTWTLSSRSSPPQGPWGGHFPELERVSPIDCGHSEVSPVTTKDPKDAQDSPSEPDTTLAPSDLPAERPCSPQPGLAAPSGRPESQVSGFDFSVPYLGPPHSRSLPDMMGLLVTPQMDMGQKPLPSGSLEYLCLPAGGQVQLVPLSQAMGQGRAQDLEKKPSPGAEGSPSLESGADPVPPAPGLMVGGQGPKDSPAALPTASGGPADSSMAFRYVTTADLTFTPPTRAPSVSQAPRLGLPSDQNHSVCPGLAGGPPGAPAPVKPEFEGYVELPPTIGQIPKSPLVSPTPPATSSPVLSLGDRRADAAPVSPHPKGLLVLQQVGDYCLPFSFGARPLPLQASPPLVEEGPPTKIPWPNALALPSVKDPVSLLERHQATAGPTITRG
ncbi:cytokine receptor common subunit beta-like isoform X1 [Equus asinus]|uniref:cytokine receptor common subunit beta-like isoform X1 n=2 Tax=Equus asinus TaxID=9793 RepID=UPI0038F7B6EF